MSLQRIVWSQIITEYVPSGATITLANSDYPFEKIYTKDLSASGDVVIGGFLNVSGSTIFGIYTGDTHQFNGQVGVTGSLSVNGVPVPGPIYQVTNPGVNRLLMSDGTLGGVIGLSGVTYSGTNENQLALHDIYFGSVNHTIWQAGYDTKFATGIPYHERYKFKPVIAYSGGQITAKLELLNPSYAFSYYIMNAKYIVDQTNINAYTKTVSASEGVWFFYIDDTTIDANNPSIQVTQNPWSIINADVLLYNFFFNSDDNIITWIGEERHTAGRDLFQHARNHAQGAVYRNGLDLSSYNNLTNFSGNTNDYFSRSLIQISDGAFFDEDILNSIKHNDNAYNSTTQNPNTNWNLIVEQFLGFTETNQSTTPGIIIFTTPRTLVTGQPVSIFEGDTTILRGEYTITSGGTSSSFNLTTVIENNNNFQVGDKIVIGARIPIYFIDRMIGDEYIWRRFSTSDFLGVSNGAPITVSNITTAIPQYNEIVSGTTLSNVADLCYYPIYLLATNLISEPIIALLGQGQSSNDMLITALSEPAFQFNNLVGLVGLEIQEIVPLYRLVFKYEPFKNNKIILVDVGVLNVSVATVNGTIIGGGGYGVTNHSALSNLNWIDSGHVGSPETIAGFDIDGNPVVYPLSTGSGSSGTSGTSGSSGTGFNTISNPADNRILTSNGTTNAANAEENFTYDGNKLTIGAVSGATGITMQIIGSSGELFKVEDNLNGFIYQVGDISGVPILRIHSDGIIYIKTTQQSNLTSLDSPFSLIAVDKITASAGYFDYIVSNAISGGYRSGTITTVWNDTQVEFTDTSTADLNNSTNDISFDVLISGGYVFLKVIIINGTWNVKIAARVL